MSPPDRVIEKLVLNELDAGTAQRLREDPEVRAREQALRQSNDEILRAYPPETIAKQLRRRATPRKRWPAVAALATAAVAVVIFVNNEPTERTKGAPALAIYRKTAGDPERLQNGAEVAAGDVLQLAYSAKGARYGTIVSLDGRGVVTWHLPSTPGAAVPLAREVTALPSAYELDAAPGFERFIFYTSTDPFTAAPTGPLPYGVAQTAITLVKP